MVVCFLEQDTCLTLLQPIQPYNEYLEFTGEGTVGWTHMKTCKLCLSTWTIYLCFDQSIYDNINGPEEPFMYDIISSAGPLMHPGQVFATGLKYK